jgi:sugar-specific transcriptional regulator TrmB
MTHAKTYSSSLEFDIIGNLEEFGLSKYEARAYITLVVKGTLGAS